ncbi:cell shape-determining protein MreC [Clostridia bacterium]|nr:cell shape-determining protein MreC [Clostridia bacterium]GHU76170.1 cell shape-determining protein MreC [Clostridia bacterium]
MDFFSEHKKMFIIVGVLLCAALMAYSVYYRKQPTLLENALAYAANPAQKFLGGITGYAGDKINFYRDMGAAAEENKELRAELDKLRRENERLKQAEAENIRLNTLFETSRKYSDYPLVAVTIIAKDPGNWYDNFTVDKGSRDGLAGNMPVIASGGLVGRVIECGGGYSKVRSIIDDSMAVSAKSVRTDDLGIVKGDMKLRGDGLCRMDRIDVHADIIAGDEIVTSNLGNIYPEGIKIGDVETIDVSADGLTKTATIRPVVDFGRLETLLVVKQNFSKEELYKDAE